MDIKALREPTTKRENFIKSLENWKARTTFEKKLVLGIMHRRGHKNFEEREDNEPLHERQADGISVGASSFYSAISSHRPEIHTDRHERVVSRYQRNSSLDDIR